jgi:predicted DCC family thiol-disulfide oxidoreductase YuxK
VSPTDTAPGTNDPWPRLVLYDGECGLCNRTVRWLVAVDRERRFRYAPLQGQLGTRLRKERGDVPEGLDTFVYLEEGRAHLRSSAFVRAARQLPYPWRALSWLWIVPRFLRDLGYRLVARIRYRVWGRYDECRIPAPEERQLFID